MSLLSLFRQLLRDHTHTLRRSTRKVRRNGIRMVLERLEDRTVPNAVVWNVAASGNWNDAKNWLDLNTSVAHVPTAADDVTVNQSNITITLSDGQSAHSLHTTVTNDLVVQTGSSLTLGTDSQLDGGLTLSGGSLTNDGTVTLDGSSNWTGGSIGGTGTLDNSGTLTIASGTSLSLGENLSNDGTLTIDTGTTLDLGSGLNLSGGGLTNDGTVTLDGSSNWSGGSIGGTGTLDNTGSLTIASGTSLSLGENLSNSGTLTIDTGTTLDLGCGLSLSGGGLTNDGSVTLDGSSNWTGGSIGGTGTLDNSGTLTIASGTSLSLGENLSNDGTLTIDTGTTLDLGGGLTLSGGGLTNDGTVTLDGSSNWTGGSFGGTGTLDNSGTLTIASGTSLSLGENLSNDGTLTIDTGTTLDLGSGLNLSGGGLTNDGTVTLDGSSNWSGGSIGGTGTLDNTGSLTIASGTSLSLGENLSNSGTLTIDTGTTLDLGSGLSLSGGSLSNDGTVTLDGSSNWSGGSIGGTGTLDNSGTLTMSGGTSLSLGEDLSNEGTLTIDTGTTLGLDGSFTQGSSGTLDVQLGGVPGSGQFGQVTITSGHSATLDGTLRAELVHGYLPKVGDDFTVMSYSSNSGTTFATVALPITPGVVFQAQVGNGTVALNSDAETAPAITSQPSDLTVTAGQTVTFTDSASGTPAPTVQWQISTDHGATFNNIPGAISTTLSFTAAAGQNGNDYRAVFTNRNGMAKSSAATLTLDVAPVVTTQPSDQTITAGLTATFMASASGTPAPTVQWQVSTDGGNSFSNISGATSTTLTLSAATASQNGYIYHAVFTNSVGSTTTANATLTVKFAPSVTQSPTNQTVTAGQSVSFTAAANANPAPTVQWQLSTNGGSTWSNISGATSTTYTISSTTASQNGSEYKAIFTNSVGSATSAAATLTVDVAPGITSNPSNLSVGVSQTATFMASASGTPAPTVQWQVSTDGGNSFTNISGATSTTLTLSSTTASENGYIYHAVFTNSVGSTTTANATLTVKFAPSVTQSPTNQTVTAGQSVSFTAAANANPAPTVQWQLSTNGGSSWSNISGATSTTYTISSTTASQNGSEYKAIFTNSVGSATSAAATLTVDVAPGITSNPSNLLVGVSQTATFTASASGSPVPTVQWQVSTDDGTTFNNIPGATLTTLSFTAAPGDNGKEYQAVFTNSVGTATTSAATLTVDLAPTIISQPRNLAAATGQTATFTASASGSPVPTVQWQVSTNHGATFTNINGATSTTLSFTVAASENGDRYRAVFTNSAGAVDSGAAALVVVHASSPVFVSTNHARFVVGSAGSFTVVNIGSPKAALSVVGNLPADLTFTDKGNGTATISGTPAAGTNGTYHLTLLAFNGKIGGQRFTLTISQTVTQPTNKQAPVVVVQPDSETDTAGGAATFTAAAIANPAARVQWQVSTNGGVTFRNILGATTTTLNVAASLARNGFEYRAVFTNSLGTVISAAATLTVVEATTITSVNHATFTVDTQRSFTITTTASSVATLSLIGGLPAGLTFTDNRNGTATVTGAPVAGTAGTYTLVFVASSDFGYAIQTFTLTIR